MLVLGVLVWAGCAAAVRRNWSWTGWSRSRRRDIIAAVTSPVTHPRPAGGMMWRPFRHCTATVARRRAASPASPDEVTSEYVEGFVSESLDRGIILVAELEGLPGLAGELHTYRSELAHLPPCAGRAHGGGASRERRDRGSAGSCSSACSTLVRREHPDITRVELITAGNQSSRAPSLRRRGIPARGPAGRAHPRSRWQPRCRHSTRMVPVKPNFFATPARSGRGSRRTITPPTRCGWAFTGRIRARRA